LTEREIHDGVQAHKPAALKALAGALKNHCERFFVSLGKETARDLLQELNARVLEAIQENRIEHPDFPIAYARGIALILRADALEARSTAIRKVIPFPVHLATPPTEELDLLRAESDAERAGILHGLLEKLPELNREIVRQSFFGHRTDAQIQKDLNISPSQFKQRKKRAVKKLRDEYDRIIRLSPGPSMLAAA